MMRKVLLGISALALTLACSQALFARNITVADHSFESFFVPTEKWAQEEAPINVFDSDNDQIADSKTHWWALPLTSSNFAWSFSGWDPSNIYSNWKGIIRNDGWYTGSIDGNQYVYLGSGKNMGIYQTLSETFEANSIYTLKIGVGDANGDLSPTSSFTAVLSSFDGTNETILGSSAIVYDGVHNQVMNDLTVTYTTGSVAPTGNIRVRFYGGTDPLVHNQGDWNIDNVRLSVAATPEPSSLMAMFGGLAGLGMVIRRKRS